MKKEKKNHQYGQPHFPQVQLVFEKNILENVYKFSKKINLKIWK